jgi:leader peptidase (prepilin peptidase)/N-methyltransferase
MFETLKSIPPEQWQTPAVWLCIWIFGTIWGSFLNVCIIRVQHEMSLSFPGSHCFSCKKKVDWYDNIPVLSWFLLRGKCRHCGERFSFRYPFVEIVTGGFFLAVWVVFGATPVTLCYWLMTFGLLWGTGVDFDAYWIPDRVTWGGIIVGIPLSALVPELHQAAGWQEAVKASATGAALGFGILYGVGVLGKLLFRKDAMGFGDVKLLGAIGAFLGAQAVVFVLFVSAFIGSIVGVSLIAMGKRELGGRIPFGPYLSAAALIWMLGGDGLMDWYLDLVLGPPGAGL